MCRQGNRGWGTQLHQHGLSSSSIIASWQLSGTATSPLGLRSSNCCLKSDNSCKPSKICQLICTGARNSLSTVGDVDLFHVMQAAAIAEMGSTYKGLEVGAQWLAYLSEIKVDLLQRVILLLQREDIGSISDCSSILFLLITSGSICSTF